MAEKKYDSSYDFLVDADWQNHGKAFKSGRDTVQYQYTPDGKYRREVTTFSNGNKGYKYYVENKNNRELVLTSDSRGNRRDASGTVIGPTGGRVSTSHDDTERLQEEADADKRISDMEEYWAKKEAEINAKLEPYLAVGRDAIAELAKYRANPAAYVEGQYGFKEGQKEGISALESAAAARGDFLGDGSKKRIAKFEVDYLSGKKNEALQSILALLGVGQAATGASVNTAAQVAAANQAGQTAGIGVEQGQSAAVHNQIAQAAAMRNMEMLQRSQQIADRQTALLNAGGNVLAATPLLFAKAAGAGA